MIKTTVDFAFIRIWILEAASKNTGTEMKLTKLFAVAMLALLSLPLFAQETHTNFQPGRNIQLGVGYGLPYGGILGVGVDMYVFEKLALSLGFGSFVNSAGFEAGLKYQLGNMQSQWRPEAILLYGTNGILPSDDVISQTEVYNGISAGLGTQAMFGKKRQHGLDAGVTYVVTSGLYQRLKELEDYDLETSSPLGFYLGYRFAFELKY